MQSVHIHCNLATLHSWIKEDSLLKEKQVQISQSLFAELIQYFVLDIDIDYEKIKTELNNKLDTIALRQLYTTYKTASTDEEKEIARQKYLDEKGIDSDFRW